MLLFCVVEVVAVISKRAVVSFIFFFKQKTAYEMLRSLVGSEMCIRDRYWIQSKDAQEAFIQAQKATRIQYPQSNYWGAFVLSLIHI